MRIQANKRFSLSLSLDLIIKPYFSFWCETETEEINEENYYEDLRRLTFRLFANTSDI